MLYHLPTTTEAIRANCDRARAAIASAPTGSKRWRYARYDLSFWQAKAATHQSMVQRGLVAA